MALCINPSACPDGFAFCFVHLREDRLTCEGSLCSLILSSKGTGQDMVSSADERHWPPKHDRSLGLVGNKRIPWPTLNKTMLVNEALHDYWATCGLPQHLVNTLGGPMSLIDGDAELTHSRQLAPRHFWVFGRIEQHVLAVEFRTPPVSRHVVFKDKLRSALARLYDPSVFDAKFN